MSDCCVEEHIVGGHIEAVEEQSIEAVAVAEGRTEELQTAEKAVAQTGAVARIAGHIVAVAHIAAVVAHIVDDENCNEVVVVGCCCYCCSTFQQPIT